MFDFIILFALTEQCYPHLPVYKRTFTQKLSGKSVRLFTFVRLGITLMSDDFLNMPRTSEPVQDISGLSEGVS